jgi:hypothetical protein
MGRTWRTHGIKAFGKNPEGERPMEDVDLGVDDKIIWEVISKK